MNEVKGTALITGASAGIGAIYADRLARRGYDLLLVARSAAKLDHVAKAIREATGRNVETLSADLSNPGELRLIEARLINDRRITMLVNNAGIGAPVPTWQADIDQMESMIDINATALARLTYAVAQRFAAAGNGTIINIASTVAIAPEFMLNGVYGATKAFVIALTASLHAELAAVRALTRPGARERAGV